MDNAINNGAPLLELVDIVEQTSLCLRCLRIREVIEIEIETEIEIPERLHISTVFVHHQDHEG